MGVRTPWLDCEARDWGSVRPELFILAPGGTAVSGPRDSDPMAAVGLLDDAVVRTVLEATARRPRSAADLADLADVSRQTVYRRLERLQAAGLVAERTRPRADGHHETAYEATFEELRVELTDEGLSFTLDLEPPESDAADELTKLWRNFR
jgi:DNA-binding transcriptional MocR family regulator